MENLFLVVLIGISLSMDAFSLSIVYGTYNINRMDCILLSIIVGMFHFFMPLFGLLFGNIIMKFFLFSVNFIVGIIFLIIGISMIVSVIHDDKIEFFVNIVSFLLFGFSVSIDSFSTGIGLSFISNNFFLVSSIFMIVSGLFTYIGLSFGKYLNSSIGKYSNIIGGVIMIFLAVYYLLL